MNKVNEVNKEEVMTAMEHMKEYGGERAQDIIDRMARFKGNVDQMFFMLAGAGDLLAIKVLYDDLSKLLFSSRCLAEETAKDMDTTREILEDK